MRVKIEKFVYGGYGIGYTDGKACFVPFSLPQEEVEVEVKADKKSYYECRLKEIINPSPSRVVPPCRYYTVCGGCDMQHTSYENQFRLKVEMFKDQLSRISKIDIQPSQLLPSKEPFGYRNRAQLKFDGNNLGFYKRESHQVVDIESCLLLKEDLKVVLTPLKKFLIKYGLLPENIHIFSNNKEEKLIKFIFKNSQQLLNIIPKLEVYQEEINQSIKGVCFESGKDRIELGQRSIFYQVGRYRFRVSMDSFFQVNIYQIESLINIVLEYLEKVNPKKVVDFYCGIGTFSIPAGFIAKEVLGIEANEPAVKDAKANVGHNNLKNVKFLKAKTGKGIRYGVEFKPDTVILDPPRSGIGKRVVKDISKIRELKNIIYISCNPATLARDIDYFQEEGFTVEDIKIVDMFPQTHHIESVSLLKRKD